MKYLLVMSFSGSTMVGIYALLKFLMKDKISARLQYLLAKAAVMFYLVPLPFLRKWYGRLLTRVVSAKKLEVEQVSLKWGSHVIYANGKMYGNVYIKSQIIVIGMWLLISFALLLAELFNYMRTRHALNNYIDRTIIKESAVLERLKRQYGVKRKIIVCQAGPEERTMTFGFFRPVILCSHPIESRESEVILGHELVHIKNWDTLWKILHLFVLMLHWWNPAVWILHHDFERVCEWSCDEVAMQGKTKEEVKEYLRLLVNESKKDKRKENALFQWSMSFGESAKRLQRRMENLMKRRKWNGLAAGILMTVLVLANSLTVFAYEDVACEKVEDNISRQDIDRAKRADLGMFVFDEISMEQLGDVVQYETSGVDLVYEKQFVDAKGNIYQIEGEGTAVPYWGCNHEYDSGKYIEHVPESDGGCVVLVYSAKKCSKCGLLVKESKISETIYTVCPHK